SIFGDSLWFQRLQVYQRKSSDMEADKSIKQTLLHRTLTRAVSSVQAPVYTVITDTLGWENVTTPAGTFRCRKVTRHWGIAATEAPERHAETLAARWVTRTARGRTPRRRTAPSPRVPRRAPRR